MIKIRHRGIVAVAFLIAVAVLCVYFYFDPSDSEFFPRCIFKQLTGFDCPGCGSQRAIHALLHGNISGAWHYNALMLLLLPLSLLLAAVELCQQRFPRLYNILYSRQSIWAILVVIILWTIGRNIV